MLKMINIEYKNVLSCFVLCELLTLIVLNRDKFTSSQRTTETFEYCILLPLSIYAMGTARTIVFLVAGRLRGHLLSKLADKTCSRKMCA